jgi:dihydroorotase
MSRKTTRTGGGLPPGEPGSRAAVAPVDAGQDLADRIANNACEQILDLATTMSKLLALGLSLPDVLRMATAAPARVLGEADTIGTRRPGAVADATLFRIESGSFALTDSHGETVVAGDRLAPVRVVRNGVVSPAGSAAGAPA